MEVGRGNLAINGVAPCLEGSSEIPRLHTAPAAGLFFEQAFYEERELDDFLEWAAEDAL